MERASAGISATARCSADGVQRLFTAADNGLIFHTCRNPSTASQRRHALAHVRSHVQMLALLTASTSQVELTTKNFDKHVFGSGKSAFVKFLAPW